MDSRALAALLSPLISQVILLLLPLFPPNSNSQETLFPVIHHFLSASEAATSISLLSRKRKRTHHQSEPDDSQEPIFTFPRVNSVVRIPSNPDSFRAFFKMTSSTFEWLSALLEPLLECRDPVGSPLNLSAETRLGVGLYRLANGSDYPEISTRFGISEPAVEFCVKQLCRVLCTNFRFWVGFPNQTELVTVASQFQNASGLPNCCGIIDCTRFKVVRRNGYLSEESIVAQIVVDSSSRILNIVAGFRGERSDFEVLRSSTLYEDIEGQNLLNSPSVEINHVSVCEYLVGGGRYPLLPWLIVPFVDPLPGSPEENFNVAHNLMRLPGFRTIASLRNWGVLSRPIEAEFKTAVAYIGAISILHNALLMREDYSALSDGVGVGVDEYPLVEQSGGGSSLKDKEIEKKASEIRTALAARAKETSKPDGGSK